MKDNGENYSCTLAEWFNTKVDKNAVGPLENVHKVSKMTDMTNEDYDEENDIKDDEEKLEEESDNENCLILELMHRLSFY